MNIRPLESLTKEDLIELIKHERADHCEDILNMVPDGFKLVPVEPTDEMHVAARDWSAGKYGKAIGLDASEGCYKAMLAAAPQPDHFPNAGKMVWSDRSMKEIKAALAGAKGKEHTLIFSAKEVRGLLNTIVNQNQRIERFEKKIADQIAQDRKMDPDDLDEQVVNFMWLAWMAAIKADHQRRSEPVNWKDGYRAAMNEAGWAVRELYVNHVHHTDVGGLLKRCQELEQSFIRSAEDAPQPDHIPGATKMVPVDKDCLTAEPTDSEMLDWLILSGSGVERRAISARKVEYRVIDVFGDIESTSETAREAIKKAMRDEE